MQTDIEKKYRPWVFVASVVIPLVVAALFGVKIKGYDFSFLPPIYASINALTAIILVAAVIAIKKGNRNLHQNLIKLALLCSVLFLCGYITYHITSEHVLYGDLNHNHFLEPDERTQFQSSRLLYLLLLISHIVLSIVEIPLVLFTYLKGFAGNYQSHKKWARKTFPIWLYVAISGVAVYIMISPFYGH
ncbi:MAG: DUF420 domain-containing protein [Crocinitomicaceae bacterium]|nr:DUF420 domain-containing protein [Crocinitomicaceae bacterium]